MCLSEGTGQLAEAHNGYQMWTSGEQTSQVLVGDWTGGQSTEKGGSCKDGAEYGEQQNWCQRQGD